MFTAEKPPDVGGLIEYVITLSLDGHSGVNLRCIGKVLRAHRMPADGTDQPLFAVAVTLERYEFCRSED